MIRGNQSYLERIDEATERLVTRQIEFVRLASNSGKDTGTIAVETAEIAACSTSMIRAVEDLLAVTSSLKEAWVLGHVLEKDGREQDTPEKRTAALESTVKVLRGDI